MPHMSFMPVILLALVLFPAFAAAGLSDESNQEHCEKIASHRFEKAWGDGMLTDKEGATLATYSSHFNNRMQKCLMLVDVATTFVKKKSQSVHSIFLEDAGDEDQEYGAFVQKGARYLGKSRQDSFCSVEGRPCHTQIEFMQQVKRYMEE